MGIQFFHNAKQIIIFLLILKCLKINSFIIYIYTMDDDFIIIKDALNTGLFNNLFEDYNKRINELRSSQKFVEEKELFLKQELLKKIDLLYQDFQIILKNSFGGLESEIIEIENSRKNFENDKKNKLIEYEKSRACLKTHYRVTKRKINEMFEIRKNNYTYVETPYENIIHTQKINSKVIEESDVISFIKIKENILKKRDIKIHLDHMINEQYNKSELNIKYEHPIKSELILESIKQELDFLKFNEELCKKKLEKIENLYTEVYEECQKLINESKQKLIDESNKLKLELSDINKKLSNKYLVFNMEYEQEMSRISKGIDLLGKFIRTGIEYKNTMESIYFFNKEFPPIDDSIFKF